MFKYILLICSLFVFIGDTNGQDIIPVVSKVSANVVTLTAMVDDIAVKKADIPAGTLVEFKTTKPAGTKGNWLVYSTATKTTGFKASTLSNGEDVARYIRQPNIPAHKLFVTYQVIDPDGKQILSALVELNYGSGITPTPVPPTPKPNPDNPTPTPVPPTPGPCPDIPVILSPSTADQALTADIPRFMVSSDKKQLKEDAISLAVMYNTFADFVINRTDMYTNTKDIQDGNKLVGITMFDGYPNSTPPILPVIKGRYQNLGTVVDKAIVDKLTLKIETLDPQKRVDAVNIIRAIAWQFAEVAKK